MNRSFLRGGRLFKLRYAYIDICKSLRGTLRFLELGGATGQQSAFTHTCEYFSDNVGVEVWSGSHSDACSPKYEIAHATPGTAQAGRGKDISSLVPRGADGPEQRDDLHDTAVLHVRHLGRWEARVDLCSGLIADTRLFTDCVRFQENLLASELVFIAGIAEAKSKGRGEECISQNLRILRGANDRQVILFFANSQRKDRKRYVSIPGASRA